MVSMSDNGLGMGENESSSHEMRAYRDRAASLAKNSKLQDWLWEILAGLFNLACMGVVIIVLLEVNGMPVEKWAFKITPNAVVSFLATLAKSSFIMVIAEIIGQLKWLHFSQETHALTDIKRFDEASRGPWGSTQLLVRKNIKTAWASVACVVTIAALFMDPLVQLVIVFRLKDIPVYDLPINMPVSFSTAKEYFPNYPLLENSSSISAPNVGQRAPDTAILDGLLHRDWAPQFECPTGNCTWLQGKITTLAVCGSCSDDTDKLKVNCSQHDPPRADMSYCVYTFPNGLETIAWLKRPWVVDITATQKSVQTKWNSTVGTLPLQLSGDALMGQSATIANFSAIQVPDINDDETIPLPRARTCRLDFCSQTFGHVTSTQGKLHINSTSEMPLVIKNYVWHNPSKNGDRWTESTQSSTSMQGLETFQLGPANSSDSTQGGLHIADYRALQIYLAQAFSFAWTSNNQTTATASFLNSTSLTAMAPEIAYHLSGAENLASLVVRLSARMTEMVRVGGSTNVTGTALTQKPVIQVRWGLLTYPLVLLFSTLILLVVVIRRTKVHKQVAWKNSSLALLFHDVEYSRAGDRGFLSVKDLERVAADLNGRTGIEGRRLRVVWHREDQSRDA